MALAETAVLAVELKINGVTAYTSGIAKAEAATATLGKTTTTGLTSGLAKAEKGLGKVTGALGHAKSAIGGLVTGPLGLIGLSAGLLSVGGAIEHGIAKAQDFGVEVSKLKAITGLSADTVSALASAFEHFGLSSDSALRSVGMLEKNVGLLASKKDGLKDFAATFGLALTANGKLKDANALILTAADYFNNKLIPASTKAAALAKLFGRSWQELIPLLAAGSKGILDAEAAAKDLGLTLSETNVSDLAKFKESTRELGTAVGGLELQIGLALVPSIKAMADSLTSFVRDNRVGIVQFFKDAATNVGKFGDFLSKDVIPPLKSLGTAAANAWKAIPDPLKQILIGGIIANKAGKFLFDISIKDAVGGLAGLAGRGASALHPVFVKDVGIKGGPNIGPEVAAAPVAAIAATFATIVGAPFYLQWLTSTFNPTNNPNSPVGYNPGLNNPGATNISGLPPGVHTGSRTPPMPGFGQFIPGSGLPVLTSAIQDIKDASQTFTHGIEAVGAAAMESASALRSQAALTRDHSWLSNLAKGIHERSIAKFGGNGLGASAEQATYQRDVLGRAASIAKSGASSATKLERMKQLIKDSKDATTATKNKLSQDLKDLQSKVKDQKPPSVSVTVGTNVQVSANSVVATFKQTQSYGPSDPQHKHGGDKL